MRSATPKRRTAPCIGRGSVMLLTLALAMMAGPNAAAQQERAPNAAAAQLESLARAAYQQNQFGRAAAMYDAAYAADPLPRYLLWLSRCHEAAGSRAKAAVYMTKYSQAIGRSAGQAASAGQSFAVRPSPPSRPAAIPSDAAEDGEANSIESWPLWSSFTVGAAFTLLGLSLYSAGQEAEDHCREDDYCYSGGGDEFVGAGFMFTFATIAIINGFTFMGTPGASATDLWLGVSPTRASLRWSSDF